MTNDNDETSESEAPTDFLEQTFTWRTPDYQYVSSLRNRLVDEWEGFHEKITEIELLRYFEDEVEQGDSDDKHVPVEVRVGLTAELIENVKAALLSNLAQVSLKGHRSSEEASKHYNAREKHLQALLNYYFSTIGRVADSQVGNAIGILKVAKTMSKWPRSKRRRRKGEDDYAYVDRVEGYKKQWGPPIDAIDIHPLTFYPTFNVSGRIDECLEVSYKSKYSVFEEYKLEVGADKLKNVLVAAMPGTPLPTVRPMAREANTYDSVEVIEYWNPGVYQVYIASNLVLEESPPKVCYFTALGRGTSSMDLDKIALSVAENLRPNEPALNRVLTRMVDAADLIVRKRNTLELADGTILPQQEGEEGDNKPWTTTFEAGKATALPEGAKVVDPFQGVEAVFAALPVVQMMMQLMAQHGVSPLFRGISPGAAGSGYRDNSLYLMAKAQFNYFVKNLEKLCKDFLCWYEDCVASLGTDVWMDEYKLSPSDIRDWPATITVTLKPEIPVNLIAEGEFWARQQEAGNVTRKRVREQGLGIEQPQEEDMEVRFERLTEQLEPFLFYDVLQRTFGQQMGGGNGLVDTQGNPISSGGAGGGGAPGGLPGGLASLLAGRNANGAGANNVSAPPGMPPGIGRANAGRATGGQPRRPSQVPGGTPGMNGAGP